MSQIEGRIVLADMILEFRSDDEALMVDYTIKMEFGRASMRVPQDKFLKALAIAVHNDGMPDFKIDYDDAESVMPKDDSYRWIP